MNSKFKRNMQFMLMFSAKPMQMTGWKFFRMSFEQFVAVSLGNLHSFFHSL